jgi:hypothetical protein
MRGLPAGHSPPSGRDGTTDIAIELIGPFRLGGTNTSRWSVSTNFRVICGGMDVQED